MQYCIVSDDKANVPLKLSWLNLGQLPHGQSFSILLATRSRTMQLTNSPAVSTLSLPL